MRGLVPVGSSCDTPRVANKAGRRANQRSGNIVGRARARCGFAGYPILPSRRQRVIVERRRGHTIILHQTHVGLGPARAIASAFGSLRWRPVRGSRCPIRHGGSDVVDFVERAVCGDEVARILHSLVRQFDDLDMADDRRHGCGNLLRMRAACVVFVCDDDNRVKAAQRLTVFRAPLAGAHWITRRDRPKLAQLVGVFLAFDDEYRTLRVSVLGSEQFRQAVEHAAHAVEIPAPTTIAVGPALPKILWVVESESLKEQLARLFFVIVLACAPYSGSRLKKIASGPRAVVTEPVHAIATHRDAQDALIPVLRFAQRAALRTGRVAATSRVEVTWGDVVVAKNLGDAALASLGGGHGRTFARRRAHTRQGNSTSGSA